MITYGTPDADTAAFDCLMQAVEGREVAYIIHHQRVDMAARACRWPGSLRVQAVMKDQTVVTVRQMKPGGPAKVEN